MIKDWKSILHYDPLPALLDRKSQALILHVRNELLDERDLSLEVLRHLPEINKLAGNQRPNGAWVYPGKIHDHLIDTNYNLLETYRNLRLMVEIYGLGREDACLARAVEYLFSCQTQEGDIRGILGTQYMPYYHGAILELMVKAGYKEDERVEKGMKWLLGMRQDDGGWIVPSQMIPARAKRELWHAPPVHPDRSWPHSHLATGMVLRAFAAHPDYRYCPEAQLGGRRLMERLFQADRYNDRKAPAYWYKFQFPFWWTSLLTAMNTLTTLGFSPQEPQIGAGVTWFVNNQSQDGLWETGYGHGKGAEENRFWVGFAICCVLKSLDKR